MSNIGKSIVSIIGARVVGQVKYTRAYEKQGGKKVQQKASIHCLVNNSGYTAEDGTLVDGSKVSIYLTAWGKLADTCAKYLAQGKEFSCDAKVTSYQTRVTEKGKDILDSAGQPATTIKNGFTIIPESFVLGPDSQVQIDKEIGDGRRHFAWDGRIPTAMVEQAMINGSLAGLIAQAKEGPNSWKASVESKKAAKFIPGMKTFCEAIVVEPADATLNAHDTTANAVAAAVNELRVDGYSFTDMLKAGWTVAKLLKSKYAPLVPVGMNITPPPAPPADEMEAGMPV